MCIFFPTHEEGRESENVRNNLARNSEYTKRTHKLNCLASPFKPFTKLLHCKILSLSFSLFAFHTQHTLNPSLFHSATFDLFIY